MSESILKYDLAQIVEIRIGLACGVFMFGVTSYFALFSPPKDPSQVPFLYGCLVFSIIAVVLLILANRHFSISVVVSEDCFTINRNSAIIDKVEWSDVSSMKYRPLLGYLAIVKRSTGKSIRIGKQLYAFQEFFKLAETMTGLDANATNNEAT